MKHVAPALAALALVALRASADEPAVKVEQDVAYWDAPERDAKKNALDLYVPKGDGPFPVLAWVHGGGWTIGDKAMFKHVGQAFAKRGIVTAIVGYRLSPAVAHPEHVRDVARALAWLKKHAKEHAGDPDALFVSGQSAGGHLAALVALDPKWLGEQNLKLDDLRGAIPMSGPFGALALAVFGKAFPEETREDAAPLNHAGPGKPPFLITWGDGDPPNLKIAGRMLAAKLEEARNDVATLEVKDRGHVTIVTKIGSDGDELTDAVAKFVLETAKKPRR